jgi:protein-L-isoaspartate(D-aspartate) O-methyltransferase
MCELLELDGSETVLDVGTGSGYHAALLARLARHVYSIEVHASLSARAAENLRAAGVDNVTLVVGDGSRGLPEAAPYDAINVAAAAGGEIPHALFDQLARGGRLVAPVEDGDQRLVVARRTDEGVRLTELERVRFVPLVSSRGSGAGSA